MTGSRPVIGLTTYEEQARWGVWDVPAVLLPSKYVRAVLAVGVEAKHMIGRTPGHIRAIQPLRVVDDTQERTLVGRFRQQAQHRQPDQERTCRRPFAEPERDRNGLALGLGETLGQYRIDEVVGRGVGIAMVCLDSRKLLRHFVEDSAEERVTT